MPTRKVIKIHSTWALKMMLGEPATNIWETRVTGYHVDLWRITDYCAYHEETREATTLAQAQKIARKWAYQVGATIEML